MYDRVKAEELAPRRRRGFRARLPLDHPVRDEVVADGVSASFDLDFVLRTKKARARSAPICVYSAKANWCRTLIHSGRLSLYPRHSILNLAQVLHPPSSFFSLSHGWMGIAAIFYWH